MPDYISKKVEEFNDWYKKNGGRDAGLFPGNLTRRRMENFLRTALTEQAEIHRLDMMKGDKDHMDRLTDYRKMMMEEIKAQAETCMMIYGSEEENAIHNKGVRFMRDTVLSLLNAKES